MIFNMPRGKQLNEGEKFVIRRMAGDGHAVQAIADALNRSRHVVENFLKDPENYGTKKRGKCIKK